MTTTSSTAEALTPPTPPTDPSATRDGGRGRWGAATDLIRRHPLLAFFSLAFGLSWLCWLPYVLSTSGTGLTSLRIPLVMGSEQIVGLLPGAYLGPVTAALIVTATTEGRPGLRRWGRRLVRVRVGWRWWAGVLLGVPLVILATTNLLPGATAGMTAPALSLLALYPVVLVLQFFTTAMAEEPGWRDFALPRLQRRYGAVVGTVVLGLLWGAWHLPLFLTTWGGYPDGSWLDPVAFVVSGVPLSIVMTWVFNRTGQSLPLVMVMHASINSVFSLVWPLVYPTLTDHASGTYVILIGSTIVSAVLLVATRGQLGLVSRDADADADAATNVARAAH